MKGVVNFSIMAETIEQRSIRSFFSKKQKLVDWLDSTQSENTSGIRHEAKATEQEVFEGSDSETESECDSVSSLEEHYSEHGNNRASKLSETLSVSIFICISIFLSYFTINFLDNDEQ